jgi:hypothetical protein
MSEDDEVDREDTARDDSIHVPCSSAGDGAEHLSIKANRSPAAGKKKGESQRALSPFPCP